MVQAEKQMETVRTINKREVKRGGKLEGQLEAVLLRWKAISRACPESPRGTTDQKRTKTAQCKDAQR